MKYSIVSLLLSFSASIITAQNLTKSIGNGKKVYALNCASCHMQNGQGITGAYPPLAKSDYLMADANRSIKIVRNGLNGDITVNGQKYNLPMTGVPISDQETVDVLNYIRNSWGNKGREITIAEVKKNK